MTTKKHHNFMASPFGTLIKSFMATVLTLWLVELNEGHNMFDGGFDMWKKLLTGGMVSVLPVIINWLNPAYKNYGK